MDEESAEVVRELPTEQEARVEVMVSSVAEPSLKKWRKAYRKSPNSKDGLAYATLLAAIKGELADPALAFRPANRMKMTGAGGHLYELRLTSRHRVIYLGAPEKSVVVILHYGLRRQGDRNDVLAEAERKFRDGKYDEHFTELGLEKG